MATLDIAPDWLVQGIIGVVAGGAMLRSFLVGWIETKSKIKPTVSSSTIVSAVSIGWSNDQVERVVQATETMAAAALTYTQKEKDEAAAQLLHNNQLMQRLLEKMDAAEEDAIQARLDKAKR